MRKKRSSLFEKIVEEEEDDNICGKNCRIKGTPNECENCHLSEKYDN